MFTDSSSLSFLLLYSLVVCTPDTESLMQKERVEANKGKQRQTGDLVQMDGDQKANAKWKSNECCWGENNDRQIQ